MQTASFLGKGSWRWIFENEILFELGLVQENKMWYNVGYRIFALGDSYERYD